MFFFFSPSFFLVLLILRIFLINIIKEQRIQRRNRIWLMSVIYLCFECKCNLMNKWNILYSCHPKLKKKVMGKGLTESGRKGKLTGFTQFQLYLHLYEVKKQHLFCKKYNISERHFHYITEMSVCWLVVVLMLVMFGWKICGFSCRFGIELNYCFEKKKNRTQKCDLWFNKEKICKARKHQQFS